MAITKNSNLETIWDSLINAGCTRQGAAGLMGNLYSESKCNPTCVEGLLLQRYKEDGHFSFPYGIYDQKNYDLYVSRIDKGEITKTEFFSPRSYLGKTYQYGFGLAQWTTKARKVGLWNYTKAKDKSIADLKGQIDYLIYELKNLFPSVWSIISTTASTDSASDIVLTKFEAPANASSFTETRRGYAREIYQLYKDTIITKGGNKVSINFNNYYNKLSNSGHDENGQYTGGQAGDQTGGEWSICNWYQYPWDGGWKCVLRYPDAKVREMIAEIAIEAANNNKIGYDQGQRYTYWNQLQAVGYRPSKITTACEADCSAGVIANTKAAGNLLNVAALKNLSASYTGNMRDGFRNAGFQILTDSKYLNSSEYLVPGDILLNDYNHTATNLGIGSKSGYVSPSTPIKYNQSTLTTKQIQTRLKVAGWTDIVADNSYGPKTIAAIKEFQKLYGLTVNGITDEAKTAKILRDLYRIVKHEGFDYKYYSDTYKDLKKAYGTDLKQLLHHYYKYGQKEGRKINATFVPPATSTTTTAPAKPATPKEIPVNTTGKYNTTPLSKGVVTADALNIRKGPGTNYANLVSYPILYSGNEVDVCDKVKGTDGTYWYYIRIANSKFGFANANWIKLTSY